MSKNLYNSCPGLLQVILGMHLTNEANSYRHLTVQASKDWPLQVSPSLPAPYFDLVIFINFVSRTLVMSSVMDKKTGKN